MTNWQHKLGTQAGDLLGAQAVEAQAKDQLGAQAGGTSVEHKLGSLAEEIS